MRKKDFDNLVVSIREAGRIRRGKAKPSRISEFAPVEVKVIRQGLRKSQAEFARKGKRGSWTMSECGINWKAK